MIIERTTVLDAEEIHDRLIILYQNMPEYPPALLGG
jgi:hypothetical protein